MLRDAIVTIDRSSRIPLYHQVKDWLIRQIEAGELDPGTQIPPEMTLCASLGMSRTTVREALSQLVAEGWLYRIHGIGTFVKDQDVEPRMVERLTSFAEDMQEQKIPYASQLLQRQVVPASLNVAAALQIAPGSETAHLERLGLTRGGPLVLADTYIPLILCPGLVETDLANRSLYDLLEDRYGLAVTMARRTLRASLATPYEAKHLLVPPSSPILMMKSVSFLSSDLPLEYSRLRFRGDRSRFVFVLNRSNPVGAGG
jgi:GntR family transcriptional regulator